MSGFKNIKRIMAVAAATTMLMLTGCGKSLQTSDVNDTPPTTNSNQSGNTIILTLHPNEAPITCENFEKLVNEGFYNGLTFHRVVDEFMAQGGDPSGDGTGGSPDTIKGEFAANGVDNPISHQRGVVSMARSMDYDSASSQFFICYTGNYASSLDGQYAAFANVTEGMEVVDDFMKVDRDLNSMGEMAVPKTPIRMEKVEMIDPDENGSPRVKITMNDFIQK
ncbi:peptidylprolyl isomerase [Ruminococcus flavefaciens]|uniref:peptidylprolyl isomerase n=1 Tax=Ruminococcus flavefaciens TaxID=1265 RepID=UPI000466F2A4|nr:peptidylprolyl isomerase [Ruminococcus flavefaciens]